MVKPSVARTVKEIIENDFSLQDALQRGYGNISAIARMVKPKVEETLKKTVKLESVITSVKRLRGEYRNPPADIQRILSLSTVNVRTDVAKLSVERTTRTLATVRRLLADYQEEFLQVSESISALTLIFDGKLFDGIRQMFRDEDVLEAELGLAAIIVQSPREIIKTAGCAIAFYNQVSRRRINIEDTTSCYTDTIIVVRMEEVGRAFTALTDLITSARKVRSTESRPMNLNLQPK